MRFTIPAGVVLLWMEFNETDAATLFPLSEALPHPICKTNALMGVSLSGGGIDRSSK
jgi:hypothetical protein